MKKASFIRSVEKGGVNHKVAASYLCIVQGQASLDHETRSKATHRYYAYAGVWSISDLNEDYDKNAVRSKLPKKIINYNPDGARIVRLKDGDKSHVEEIKIPISENTYKYLQKALSSCKNDSAHILLIGKLEFLVVDTFSPFH